ncbi:6-bladed beta-propeller [Geofilum rubicundum]|uniref:6-bladed beta-propeller n=1 Tax=Geofilum rubicundum JCM 15548 TaxID=1236989 RepID=A0A0E9LS70_9BACT|nr:6-bladed beta-propeller [Geofilum rubicundum]GAO28099.1 hypothetical protein JCM15548_160 [Geofilum rubicundum JCM 15548]
MKPNHLKVVGLYVFSSLLVFKFLILASCEDTKIESPYSIDLKRLAVKELVIDSIFAVDQIIQLETTEESLIKYISKIFLSEDYIVILDVHGNSALVFNSNGSFVSRIARHGRGPGEYIRLSDVYVDFEGNTIYLLDGCNSKKVLKYSLNGRFLKENSIDFCASAFTRVEENCFVFSLPAANHFNDTIEYSAIVATDSVYQRKWSGMPFDKKWSGHTYLSAITNTIFSNFNNETFFVPSLPRSVNKVYKITSSSVEPFLEVNPDNNRKLSELLKKLGPKNNETFNQIQQSDLYYNLNTFHKTGDLFFFSIVKGHERVFIAHKKGTNDYLFQKYGTRDDHHGPLSLYF